MFLSAGERCFHLATTVCWHASRRRHSVAGRRVASKFRKACSRHGCHYSKVLPKQDYFTHLETMAGTEIIVPILRHFRICFPAFYTRLRGKKTLRGRVNRCRTALQELSYRTGYCTPEPCPDTTVRDGSRRKTSSVVTRPVLSISLRL